MSAISRLKRKLSYLRDRKILKDNRTLEGARAGEACFVIGNGPSIKNQDLTMLDKQWTFAANSFFRHERYDQIHPKFYAILDSEHFKGHEASFKFFAELGAKIHPDTIVFLPLKAKEFMERNNVLPHNKKHYVYVKGYFEEKGSNNIRIDATIPTPMGVGLLCLMIADYMGFDRIYLLGFDHDWMASRIDKPIERFYSNHYFKDEQDDTYEFRLWCQYQLFKSYRLLKREMRSKVMNLTPGSFLDIFPLNTYDEVLKSEQIVR